MPTLSKQDIQERFGANIARVRALVTTYDALAGTGAGRATVAHADVLRAAVILLHAALEDLLRSLEELRLPTATPGAFAQVRFVLSAGSLKEVSERFTLVDLAPYRGQSVDEVFRVAIDKHLANSNYNNVGEVKQALTRVGISYAISNTDAAALETMMKRRHWIAHRADVNPSSGRGHHGAQSIGRGLISSWIDVVEPFGRSVLNAL